METPIIRFKVPPNCMICHVREDASENMRRTDLNEFRPQQLAQLPGRHLGRYLHKDWKYLGEIMKFIEAK